MKNPLRKILTNSLLCGILIGSSVSSVKADWNDIIQFPENSTLSTKKRLTLLTQCARAFAKHSYYFFTALTGKTVKQLFIQEMRDSNSSRLYSLLIFENGKTSDLEALLSTEEPLACIAREVQSDQTASDTYHAIFSEKDGLFNLVIRETLRPYVGVWSQEQIEESFNVLWEFILKPFNVTLDEETLENIVNTLPEDYRDSVRAHLPALLASKGNTFPAKLATFILNLIAESVDESCGCGFCKKCTEVTLEIILPIAKEVAVIVARLLSSK